MLFCSIHSVYINCSSLFLMVSNRDHLYLAISITFWVDFFSVHDVLINLLMNHFVLLQVFFLGLLSCTAFTSMQKDGPYVGFQSGNFGINPDISIGEDGLHLSKCVFKQCNYFIYFSVTPGVWNCCDAQVFKSAYLFYSLPFWKECFIQQCRTVLR